ncbi:MAG: bifunctional riboflavin kinase/FAD synthetase [Myxococcales bacterium]|nr:bifunctional riboflavin kinase/FAD synthetase [Myxococcales bacterium]
MAALLVDDARSPLLPGSAQVVVIGNFDGVHRGHVEVIRHARGAAGERGLTVLTFEPHPAALFGASPPPRLTRLSRKVELLSRLSVDTVVAQRFDHAFARLGPVEFVDQVLVDALHAELVVVGFDFRFGARRTGDLELLRSLGGSRGFSLLVQQAVADGQGAYSSTRAREALVAGDLATVLTVLGRPHSVEGVVRKGDQRGRTIGFPTANVGEIEEALPKNGVYAVAVDLAEGQGFVHLATGVANVGVRPTVATGAAPSVEVHLFDLPEARRDLYGARLRVHFATRLRDERRFSGFDELKAQIERDAGAAREALIALVPQRPGWF